MNGQAIDTFTTSNQFWSELEGLLLLSADSSVDKIDDALKNYIAFASTYLDQFLSRTSHLDNALFALLDSTLFRAHVDRMSNNIITIILQTNSASTTFIALMLLLHLGLSSPLSPSLSLLYSSPTTTESIKVFRLLRKRWKEVVPVLMNHVLAANVVEDATLDKAEKGTVEMPKTGWEERVGIGATALLYEICRVERLSVFELGFFTNSFVSHLVTLVERTRDAEDETFNYTLIKLIIALNEQFMVNSLPIPTLQSDLMAPILPVAVGHSAKMLQSQCNVVLQVLITTMQESKTFGENIIFILNRAKATPDTLPTTLLILKILFLLFTTPCTAHYFYTNDLYILLDVFLRQLNDLGPESEGLKHTFLRVLQPLLANTQLSQSNYKKKELWDTLQSMITCGFREVDGTTRRLVERNLKGIWFDSVRETTRKDSIGGLLRFAGREGMESSLSLNTVAEESLKKRPPPLRTTTPPIPPLLHPVPVQGSNSSPPPGSIIALPPSPSPSSTSISSISSLTNPRRRRPPPPPIDPSRPRTPIETNGIEPITYTGGELVTKVLRRAAPVPPGRSKKSWEVEMNIANLVIDGSEDLVR